MFIVSSYSTAIVFCIITMVCWGSWANTQKLAAKSWRFELFYWDYVIGIVLFSIISAFTLGSNGTEGGVHSSPILTRPAAAICWSAIIGGIVFNAANILFSAAIAIAGMAVAFPYRYWHSIGTGCITQLLSQCSRVTRYCCSQA